MWSYRRRNCQLYKMEVWSLAILQKVTIISCSRVVAKWLQMTTRNYQMPSKQVHSMVSISFEFLGLVRNKFTIYASWSLLHPRLLVYLWLHVLALCYVCNNLPLFMYIHTLWWFWILMQCRIPLWSSLALCWSIHEVSVVDLVVGWHYWIISCSEIIYRLPITHLSADPSRLHFHWGVLWWENKWQGKGWHKLQVLMCAQCDGRLLVINLVAIVSNTQANYKHTHHLLFDKFCSIGILEFLDFLCISISLFIQSYPE